LWGGEEQSMLRKLIRAGAIVAIFVAPATAQDSFGIPVNPKRPPSAEEIEKQKVRDRDYDAAVKKIPDKKTSDDPWGVVRPSPSAKNKQQ
jgi:hypothetical protein